MKNVHHLLEQLRGIQLKMVYEPQVSYNPDTKVWIGDVEPPYFSPDLSLGEITFNEMRRHPQLIAQVSRMNWIQNNIN